MPLSFVRQNVRGAYIASLICPDLRVGFSIPAKQQNPTIDDVLQLNKFIRKAKIHIFNFNFPRLATGYLHLVVFTDASFAKNQDLSSQLRYIIVLAYDHGNSNLIYYRSFKSQRVALSALAAKLFALSRAFDMASTIKVSLNALLRTELPLKFYTNSKSLFYASIGIGAPTEKTLLIDSAVLRQSYKRREHT